MDWCCAGLKANYENFKDLGFRVVFSRNDFGEKKVTLQHKSVDFEEYEREASSLRVLLVSEVQIVFCPWCGVDLEKYYDDFYDDLIHA